MARSWFGQLLMRRMARRTTFRPAGTLATTTAITGAVVSGIGEMTAATGTMTETEDTLGIIIADITIAREQ